MTDYMNSMARQSGAVTIVEHRLTSAFQEGQRDAEQGWPADAARWEYEGPQAVAYHAGYCQPRCGFCGRAGSTARGCQCQGVE